LIDSSSFSSICGKDPICFHYHEANERMENGTETFATTDVTGGHAISDADNTTIVYRNITNNYTYYVDITCKNVPLNSPDESKAVNETNFAPWKYIINFDRDR